MGDHHLGRVQPGAAALDYLQQSGLAGGDQATGVASAVKRRLEGLEASTEPVGVGSQQKLHAWRVLVQQLGELAKADHAERLLSELERLRQVEPRDYLKAGRLAEAERSYLAAAAAFTETVQAVAGHDDTAGRGRV